MSAILFLTLVILGVSLYGFSRPALVERLLFDVEAIRFRREYHRFLSSALVHANFLHLFFNLWVILSFGQVLEGRFGGVNVTLLFLASVAGGDGLSWLKHRHTAYRGLGASGGALGLIFSTTLLAPGILIWFLPAWLFGMLYLGYSIWAAQSGRDNIGHYAHLGGAFTGFALTAVFVNGVAMKHSFVFVGMLLFFAAAWMILFRGKGLNIKQRTATQKAARQQRRTKKDQDRLDTLLEKVANEGIHSLSAGERAFLDRESQRRRGGGR